VPRLRSSRRTTGTSPSGRLCSGTKAKITTATFYKKAVTPETLRNGMKMLEAAATDAGK
jgi:hypothetical protein